MSDNNSKYYILFVDDEEKTRKAFSRLFQNEFKILLAGDGAEGFEIFQERADEIGVIVTDQKMPRETGVQFLSKVAEINDDVVRILSTAYAELEAAVMGVNEGGIYRYVTKPWDVPELEITLRRAMELFTLRKEQSSQDHVGNLDIDQIMLSQRVTDLAFSRAANASEDRSFTIPAGASFLGMLGWQGIGGQETIDWSQRYQIQLEFFDKVFRENAETVSTLTALDWSRSSPPSIAIQAAAVGCEGIVLEFSGTDSSVWPGPAPLLSEALRPLMLAFSDLISALPGGSCRVKGNYNTVDFLFSGYPLKDGQHLLSTSPESSPVLANLLSAILLVEASGGTISLLTSNEGLAVRLGFEENSQAEDAGLSAVRQLTANL